MCVEYLFAPDMCYIKEKGATACSSNSIKRVFYQHIKSRVEVDTSRVQIEALKSFLYFTTLGVVI